MNVYRDLADVPEPGNRGRVVAIGVFDGVHRGHQRIIRAAAEVGREIGATVSVVTFEPHPEAVLRPRPAPRLLTTLARKAELIASLGIDELLVVKFDREFAKLTPGDFCHRVLSDRLGARAVVVGENFRFGRHGAGTPSDLRDYGRSHHFEVRTVSLAEDGGETISSTRIRGLLRAGRVSEAAALLGRPHRIEGAVVRGAGRGRALDAPTANLAVEAETAVPKQGVYVTRSLLDHGGVHPSVTSIGTNPTFEADRKIRIETLFLDEGEDVYGRGLALDFLERIRGQETFKDAQSLAAQIRRDVEIARGYLQTRNDLV
ncbi:MAG TPA: bifunctional riboflavin kinase/FAD synthetase [Thermoleophilia bacterium]|nr:bifunctional riboflavin kinase/FAD synthetase [Thermoleophilia bacterium]